MATADAPVPLLEVDHLFPPWLRWGFTTRHGGVSTGAYRSLNLGWDVGDDRACVRENHRRLARTLGYRPETLATVYQVHGTRVHVVRSLAEARTLRGHRGDGIVVSRVARRTGRRAPGSGAEPSPLAALVRVADCCPVVVGSLEHPVAAVLHCGWRSTVRGLVAAGVETVRRETGDERGALAAAVGPCIGPHAFEVGEEVAAEFAQAVDQVVVARRAGAPRPFVDLQAAIRILLMRAGVRPERIAVFSRCTKSEPADLYSFRRDGHDGGRQAGVVALL